jgi:hypothetical protein
MARTNLQKQVRAVLLPVLEHAAATENHIPFTTFGLVLEMERLNGSGGHTRGAWQAAVSTMCHNLVGGKGLSVAYQSGGIRYFRVGALSALRKASVVVEKERPLTKAELQALVAEYQKRHGAL